MHQQLEIPIGLREKVLNWVILGDAPTISKTLKVPQRTAEEAISLYDFLEKRFFSRVEQFVDSEKVLKEGHAIERTEFQIVESLISQARIGD